MNWRRTYPLRSCCKHTASQRSAEELETVNMSGSPCMGMCLRVLFAFLTFCLVSGTVLSVGGLVFFGILLVTGNCDLSCNEDTPGAELYGEGYYQCGGVQATPSCRFTALTSKHARSIRRRCTAFSWLSYTWSLCNVTRRIPIHCTALVERRRAG